MRARRLTLPLLLAVLSSPALAQEHFSLWYGYGIGAYLAGGNGESVNSNQIGGASLSLGGDRLRLRYVHGSFERPKQYLTTHGDNDADYHGGDIVLTRSLTHWPVEIGLGYDQHERAFVQPDGRQAFVHVWGPHLALFREQEIVRHLVLHGELDLLHAPYPTAETFAVLDLGLGIRF